MYIRYLYTQAYLVCLTVCTCSLLAFGDEPGRLPSLPSCGPIQHMRLGFSLQFDRDHCSSASAQWNVYHEELLTLIENGDIKIIDVRRPDELAVTGKMEGAFHIQLDELYQALEMPDDKFETLYGFAKPDVDDSSIVFHCRSGKRSLTALEIAKQYGYTKARHYPGGWLEWAAKNNLPTGD